MKADLLNDVINQSDYADFRAELENKFRAEARRNKWKRTAPWLAIAATVALVASLNFPKQAESVTQIIVPPPDAVPTIITSQGKADELLITAKDPFPVIRTHPFTAAIITTDRSKDFPSISDDELLRLFPKHPIGLLAAHGEKRFIFLDARDARRLMSSN